MNNKLPKIKIRVDGGPEIGLGHIVRCISLAHMLTNDFFIEFHSTALPDSLKKDIEGNGWICTDLKSEPDFFQALTGNEIVVLDGYHLDSDYQKKVKGHGSRLVCIDDLHEEYFYADLVINHAPSIKQENYQGEAYTKYLLGPDFALLRPEFLEKPGSDHSGDTIKGLFICFGGSDVNNVTMKILSWLPSKNYSVSVVAGNAYTHINDLNKAMEQREDLHIRLHNSLTAEEMKDELERADLAIVPASGILFEAISRNVPVISGYYFKNQKLFYNGFKDEGVFIDAVNFDHDSFNKALSVAENTNLSELLENQRKIIDFLSPERISDHFKALLS